MFLLRLRQLPWSGDRNPASVPPHAEGRSSPTNTPIFSPSSFILLSFAWLYIFFSTGQVLLSALTWCFACTFVPEDVLLMYRWREMYSMSTYSFAILFSSTFFNPKSLYHLLSDSCLPLICVFLFWGTIKWSLGKGKGTRTVGMSKVFHGQSSMYLMHI